MNGGREQTNNGKQKKEKIKKLCTELRLKKTKKKKRSK
jgi:hypothetical protein